MIKKHAKNNRKELTDTEANIANLCYELTHVGIGVENRPIKETLEELGKIKKVIERIIKNLETTKKL